MDVPGHWPTLLKHFKDLSGAAQGLSGPSFLLLGRVRVCVQPQSLMRYRKCFRLGDLPPTATKEELLPAVTRHYQSLVSFLMNCVVFFPTGPLTLDCGTVCALFGSKQPILLLMLNTMPWAQVVEEEEVLLRFVQSIQKYNRLSQQQAQKQQIGQMMKKPMPMAGPMSKMPPMPPGAYVAKRAPNR